MPEEVSPDTSTSSASSSPGRPAAEVFPDFLQMSSAAVDATGTGGWTFEDGSAWDPEAPDLWFNPVPCSKDADGSLKRELQLELKGPSTGDPVAARDRMLTHLEDEGYEVARVIDPPEGMDKRTWIVTATRGDGALVDYGANNAEQLLSLQSECSGHPTMQGEVSAETR
ncbi:MAG: hypothetical protein ABTA24_05970 [Arthrobacter sp.]